MTMSTFVTAFSANSGRLAAMALSCALAAGQTAWAADTAALPAEQQSQGVSYLTGGVDLDESTAIKAAMRSYPLVVEVYHRQGDRNEYTAASTLSITDPQGQAVFDTTLEGPFALLRLKPGRYLVKVTYEGQTRQQRVQIKRQGSVRASFSFGG